MDDEILAAVRALQAQMARLEREVALGGSSVEAALRRRGRQLGPHSPPNQVLLPQPAEPARLDRYYNDLRRYHFRRLLQEAIEQRRLTPRAVRRLQDRWGPKAVARTFDRLVEYGLLNRRRGTFTLISQNVRTFGDTLEWFVAQVFMREFLSPAEWDVRIQEIQLGGDFDVLTVLDGRLGYIECKGSPPYNVSAEALAHFLDRLRRLAPDFAILLLDTTLRIDRNILDNIAHLLKGSHVVERTIVQAADGIWQVTGTPLLFIVTSRRSLVANLRKCLRMLFGTG